MQRIEPKCIFQSLPHLLSLNYPLGPRTQLAWSGEQVAALTEASKSLDPCWTGKLEDLPDILKSKAALQQMLMSKFEVPDVQNYNKSKRLINMLEI